MPARKAPPTRSSCPTNPSTHRTSSRGSMPKRTRQRGERSKSSCARSESSRCCGKGTEEKAASTRRGRQMSRWALNAGSTGPKRCALFTSPAPCYPLLLAGCVRLACSHSLLAPSAPFAVGIARSQSVPGSHPGVRDPPVRREAPVQPQGASPGSPREIVRHA